MFYNPFKNQMKRKQLSDYMNNREETPIVLQGGISNTYYPQEETQTQTQNQNPSLTGTYNTVQNIRGFFGNGGGASASGGGGTPWGAIGAGAKKGYNTLFDKTDENGYDDYSDTEQTMIYPLQGASAGAQFGPWGALGGAAYGLGYSFKDDVGLDDNNWLTTLIFPVGMGDEHQGLISL